MEELDIFIKTKKEELEELEQSIGKLACNGWVSIEKIDDAEILIKKFKDVKNAYDALIELKATIKNNKK